jgi:hypothetical protein
MALIQLMKGGEVGVADEQTITLAGHLKEAFGRMKLSYPALAKQAGCSYGMAYAALAGTSLPGRRILDGLCRVLDLPFEEMWALREEERLEREVAMAGKTHQTLVRMMRQRAKQKEPADIESGVKTMP